MRNVSSSLIGTIFGHEHINGCVGEKKLKCGKKERKKCMLVILLRCGIIVMSEHMHLNLHYEITLCHL